MNTIKTDLNAELQSILDQYVSDNDPDEARWKLMDFCLAHRDTLRIVGPDELNYFVLNPKLINEAAPRPDGDVT